MTLLIIFIHESEIQNVDHNWFTICFYTWWFETCWGQWRKQFESLYLSWYLKCKNIVEFELVSLSYSYTFCFTKKTQFIKQNFWITSGVTHKTIDFS